MASRLASLMDPPGTVRVNGVVRPPARQDPAGTVRVNGVVRPPTQPDPAGTIRVNGQVRSPLPVQAAPVPQATPAPVAAPVAAPVVAPVAAPASSAAPTVAPVISRAPFVSTDPVGSAASRSRLPGPLISSAPAQDLSGPVISKAPARDLASTAPGSSRTDSRLKDLGIDPASAAAAQVRMEEVKTDLAISKALANQLKTQEGEVQKAAKERERMAAEARKRGTEMASRTPRAVSSRLSSILGASPEPAAFSRLPV